MNVLLMKMYNLLKFIYSEKAIKFCETSTLLLSYIVPVKSKVEISQNFVAFPEHMNFKVRRQSTYLILKVEERMSGFVYD